MSRASRVQDVRRQTMEVPPILGRIERDGLRSFVVIYLYESANDKLIWGDNFVKLFFIRHGQTDWNLEGRIQGSYDSELNNTGIMQAEELGRKSIESNYKFCRIYSSNQKRAVKTAEILSEATNVEYTLIKGLEEINLGEWEGLTWSEVQEKFPKEYDEWYNNRRYAKSPKGESYQELLDRVLPIIDRIINENSDDVAIVSHGAVMMCLQCYLTNTPFNEMRKFKLGNTTITEIDSELFTKK